MHELESTKTKTSELLLIKYIKITKLFVIESYHQVCINFKSSILYYEGVYVTIGHPAFCPFLHLTGAHFPVELQHDSDVSQQKISKKLASTNQNSRNRWCFIVRCTICYSTNR